MLKRCLFISGCFDSDSPKYATDYAANKVSELMIKGLSAACGGKLHVINVVPVLPWPRKKAPLLIKKSSLEKYGNKIDNITFLNIIGLKQISIERNLLKSIKKMGPFEEGDWILCYGLSLPRLRAMAYIKRRYPIKVCFIVPDLPLPEYMNADGGKIYKFAKNIDIRIQRKYYSDVDKWVYFSKYMNEYFENKDNKWIVMEGVSQIPEFEREPESKPNKIHGNTVLYVGGIAEGYGVCDLVDEFTNINDDYTLQIIGDGPAVPYIKEASAKDSRIQYLGKMANKLAYKYQIEAAVLINPRPPKDFTKYSFPSKTIEYMSTGNPVLMQKLQGVPEEYNQYINYYSSGELQLALDKIFRDYYHYKNIALSGKKFVVENKNCEAQMKRVVDFLEGNI